MRIEGIEPITLLGAVLAGFLLLIWVITLRHSAQERKFTAKLRKQMPARMTEPERLTLRDVEDNAALVMFLRRFRCAAPVPVVLKEQGWWDAFGGRTAEVIEEFKRLGLLQSVSEAHAVEVSFGVGELKRIARRLGLKVSGRKDELLERIRAMAPDELALKHPAQDWLRPTKLADEILERKAEEDAERLRAQFLEAREKRLAGFRDAGILQCEFSGSGCAIAEAMDGRILKVSEAPKLPLPGCDQQECVCDWLAVIEDRKET